MPPRKIDPRLTALFNAFGLSRFNTYDAHEVLGGPIPLGIYDDRYQLIEGYRLLPRNPALAAVRHWKKLYRPVMQSLGDTITPTAFAKAAAIPYATANTILSLMHREKIVEQVLGSAFQAGASSGPSTSYRLTRRKVVIRRSSADR
jgi:hypothetical protein